MMTSETKRHSSKIKPTDKNYFSNEINWAYQTNTVFKDFMSCEARALATLKGEYKPPKNVTPLLVGNHLHSYFESKAAHETFIQENQKEMISSRGKTKGELKSDYKIAEKMVEALDTDGTFKKWYQGEREVIVQGKIFGVDWIGKVDCLNLDKGYFVDLKTTKSIKETKWNPVTKRRESFIDQNNYYLQLAVYRELIYQTFNVWCRPLIIAVSKEPVPDKAAINFNKITDQDKLSDALYQVGELQPHIEAVKNGIEKPVRCENCDYCKSTRDLPFIFASDLDS